MQVKTRKYTLNGTREYMAKLYHAEVAKHLIALLQDGTNVDTDPELAATITERGCPCQHQVVAKARREHGYGNRWARMRALKQAAHKMVANQPIDIG